MRRFVAVLAAAALVNAPAAAGWTWPVDGPVLRPFAFGSNPYAAGQHRGIDVGAAPGTVVQAAAAGTVSFVGTVPAGGRTVTVRTDDGYSVTLLQLGSTLVAPGAQVSEGEPVGTIGPSSDPATPEPHVHLGVRVTADPQGYLDPLLFLPPRATVAPPAEAPPAVVAPVEPVPSPGPVEQAPAEPVESAGRGEQAPAEAEAEAVDASLPPVEPTPIAASAPSRRAPEAAAPEVTSPAPVAGPAPVPASEARAAIAEPARAGAPVHPPALPVTEPTSPDGERVVEEAETAPVAAEAPDVLLTPRVVAGDADVGPEAIPSSELAGVGTSSAVRFGRAGSRIVRTPDVAPIAGQVPSEPSPSAARPRSSVVEAPHIGRPTAAPPMALTLQHRSEHSASGSGGVDQTMIVLVLLPLLAAAAATALAVRRRVRGGSSETSSSQLSPAVKVCPLGRVRPPRLVHACARASDPWLRPRRRLGTALRVRPPRSPRRVPVGSRG